ncbi:unnamed protein product [Allacma fusca]|uniref:C2H2-type domain-containing protein n=1 Tax=Allacma fusca TaxID=39272 RepID=A0A8J2JDN5_9HEXA|nr:unnamed protein product [Allacma fusca]
MSFNSSSVETLGNKCSFCPKYFPSFTRQRNHESLEHYAQLQELMESMGVKANGTLRTSVSPNPFINDKDKRLGVPTAAKRKAISDSGSQSGPITCPLCSKTFKTHQTLKMHVEKKHPDSKSYSLRHRNCESSPDSAGAVTSSKNFKVRVVGTARLKTDVKMSKRLPETKNSKAMVPEPVGSSIACKICLDIFYDDKYLKWHIKHEHPHHVQKALSESGKDISCSDEPGSSDQTTVLSPRGEFGSKTSGESSVKESASTSSVLRLQSQQHQRPARNTFSCSRCPLKFLSHARLGHGTDLATTSDTAAARSTRGRIAPRKGGEKGVYYCPLCDYQHTSHTDAELEKHIVNDHADVPGTVSCLHCKHEFEKPLLLLYHLRHHDAEKPFCCNYCDQKFRQYHEKLTHEVNHTKDNDGYSCSKCGCCYLTLASLERHTAERHS